MNNSREEFKETLALTLETMFDELKQNSKQLAQNCILPTESMEIKINPMFRDTCPSIQVTYNFLPNKEVLPKFSDARNKYISQSKIGCFRRTNEDPS